MNWEKKEEMMLGMVNILPGAFSSGFECDEFDLVVISTGEVFETKKPRRKMSSTFKDGEKVVFADLFGNSSCIVPRVLYRYWK